MGVPDPNIHRPRAIGCRIVVLDETSIGNETIGGSRRGNRERTKMGEKQEEDKGEKYASSRHLRS